LALIVSKDNLDGYLLPQGVTLQVANSEVGVQKLIAQLKPLAPHLVVAESTGGLERTLVCGLQSAAIPVAIANPRKVKGFAIALGKAKTDKLDAEVIARFTQSVNLQPQAMITASAQQLSDLIHRRQQWVEIHVAEKNRLSRASKTVQADIEDHLKQLEQRLESLNQQIQTLGNSKPIGSAKIRFCSPLKALVQSPLPSVWSNCLNLVSSLKNSLLVWLGLLPSITTAANTRVNG
jgi:transposase